MRLLLMMILPALLAGDAWSGCPGGRCPTPPAYYPPPSFAQAVPPRPAGDGWNWDGRYWCRPVEAAPAHAPEVPAAPPAKADFPEGGVIRDGRDELPPGFHGPRDGAERKAYGDSLPPDDSAWPRVTAISSGSSRSASVVAEEIRNRLSGVKAIVQGFEANDWQVKGLGFVTPADGTVVYVQHADGKVALRTTDPLSPAIAGAVRRASPDYDPSKDPDGQPKPPPTPVDPPKPNPTPDAPHGKPPLPLLVAGGVLLYFFFRKG